MLFPSISFLFLFLPFVLGGYYILPKEARNTFLLLMSIVFYGWDNPNLVLLMLGVIFVNYIGALCIHHFYGRGFVRKIILLLTLLTDFGVLGYFKYYDFIVENLNAIFGSHFALEKIILPLGISFYTFQAVSYTIDVYRNVTPVQKNPFKLALFISLFPQLIAGPIIRYNDIYTQIDQRSESFSLFLKGLKRFIIGLGKKVIIANTLAETADKIMVLSVDQLEFGIIWLGVISKGLQVYFDFSGYSDMAIGLGLMFGFKFLENFNYPFISKSITEFWRRWHISLGMWFREYVYFPLGGSRVGAFRHYFNLFAIFFLIGLWHGASWNFVLWGCWFGVFIIIEKLIHFDRENTHWFVNVFRRIWTLFIFFFSISLIHTDTLQQAIGYIRVMLGIDHPQKVVFTFWYYVNHYFWAVFIVACLGAFGLFKRLSENTNKWIQGGIWLCLIPVSIWSVMAIVSTTYNPFIYFRF